MLPPFFFRGSQTCNKMYQKTISIPRIFIREIKYLYYGCTRVHSLHLSHLSMITSTSPSSLVIDFSDLQHTDKHPLFDFDLNNFMDWVKSYPRRSDIHVFVRSSIVSASNRKLQSRLQALGCTVTRKVTYK